MKTFNTINPLTLVIFGATGNLYADKLAKALFLIYQKGGILPNDFKVLAFARKDFTTDSFRSYTKEVILKRGSVEIGLLEEFLVHVEYFQGDFASNDDFLRLKEFLLLNTDRSVIIHLATASFLYEKIFENIKMSDLYQINKDIRIMIEKPFGRNEVDTKRLQNILADLFNEDQIFHIDHYLAKETAIKILDFRFKNGLKEVMWNAENIKKIKVIFHESNLVGSRGASYDAVGAFRDVGENHMLELLALTIMDKPNILDEKNIRESREKALLELDVDYSRLVTKGQYQGYLSELGILPESKTETFFRVFFQSRNPRFRGVEIELEGGKGLVDIHSDITTTSVSVEVFFNNGDKQIFTIQPVPGTLYDSYSKVYTDAFIGDHTFFSSIKEIISEWKLADNLLAYWENIPLVIYPKGTKPEDIK